MTGRHGTDDMNREIATMIRHTMQSIRPDSMLLAESTNDAAADFDGTTWHGAMTYSNFTRPLWQWLTKEEVPVNFFGTPIPGPNRISAKQFVQTHQALAAAFPWRIRTQNMNALNSHDTARAATVMIPGGQLVGLAMIFTLPGIPTLFAGDEFGLEGINGEEARTPMPWEEHSKIRADLRPDIAELSRLRRELPALHEGNLRWLYAGDDVLIYVREHQDACVLIAAARAAFEDVELPASLIHTSGITAGLSPLWGSGTFSARSTPQAIAFSGAGPSLQLWRLPGIEVPELLDPCVRLSDAKA
jgi:alpha-glucosidase